MWLMLKFAAPPIWPFLISYFVRSASIRTATRHPPSFAFVSSEGKPLYFSTCRSTLKWIHTML